MSFIPNAATTLSANSSTAALNAGATFTGTAADVSQFASVVVACLTDQSGTLYFDDVDYLIKIPARTDICPRVLASSANNIQAKVSYRIIKVKE